ALVPTKDWGLPVFDSLVNANYGINAMDNWFWFSQYTPSVEANNRLYYADSTGVLRSFTSNGIGAAAFLPAPLIAPVVTTTLRLDSPPPVTVSVTDIVSNTTKAPNRPTQYIAITKKVVGSVVEYSTPTLIDVVAPDNYDSTVLTL